MTHRLDPDYHLPADGRAAIARELANYYHELSEPDKPPFSLARLLRARANGQPPSGRERDLTRATSMMMDQHVDYNRPWVPLSALGVRTMTSMPGATGGFLVGADTMTPADVLRPWSVAAQAGVQVLPNLKNDIVIPRVTSAVSAGWIGEDGAGATATDPVLGNVSMTPRTGVALLKFSQQLLRQGEAVEGFVRMMLLRAIGQLIDEAFFSGSGGAAPLGLLNTTGTVAQSGTSLARAGLAAMRRGVLASGAQESRLQWVGTPLAQETLSKRDAGTDTARFLWADDARILGLPATATTSAINASAQPLVLGDFSTSVLGIFSPGIQLAIDPTQDFESAGLVARVLLFCDIAHPRPEAYAVAADVS